MSRVRMPTTRGHTGTGEARRASDGIVHDYGDELMDRGGRSEAAWGRLKSAPTFQQRR